MFNLLSTVWFGAIFILLTVLYFQSISTVVKERKKDKDFCRRKRLDYRISRFMNYEKMEL